MADDDLTWFRALHARDQAERAARLTAAEADPTKEPFDFNALAQAIDVTPEYGQPDWLAIEAAWRERYYLRYPDLRTMAAFIELMVSMAPYR